MIGNLGKVHLLYYILCNNPNEKKKKKKDLPDRFQSERLLKTRGHLIRVDGFRLREVCKSFRFCLCVSLGHVCYLRL